MSVKSSEGLRFFGPFQAMHELALPQTQAMDLYEGFYSHFYDFATRTDEYDLPKYRRWAQALGSPILELACGSGRLSVPLARAGFEVVGVERSKDMLSLLEKRLQREPIQVRELISPVQASMTDFSIERTFRYAFLGALSICLLVAADQRLALFHRVAEHLHPCGRFSFDYLATSEEALREQDDRIVAVPAVRGSTKRITLLGRRYYPEEQVQVVNFFSEVADASNNTHRYLASTVKWIVDMAAVRPQLAQAGLEVVSEETILRTPGSWEERVVLVTCRPA